MAIDNSQTYNSNTKKIINGLHEDILNYINFTILSFMLIYFYFLFFYHISYKITCLRGLYAKKKKK